MVPDLPFWRRLPLAYKLVLLGLVTVLTVTGAVMVVTFLSAGEGLKLQMERQLSRDLNVVEAWYRTRLEELQLAALGLARERELRAALARGSVGAAGRLLEAEKRRLGLDLAVLVDRRGEVLGGAPFDPHGLVTEAIARREQLVGTEALPPAGVLVRLVATPVGGDGALVLGERVGVDSAIPRQITSMIGGALALLDRDSVLASAGFPEAAPLRLAPEVWADVRAGRYFFAEQRLGGREYLMAFRPILDRQGTPVGAIARAFPEEEILETLLRYAGGIVALAAAVVLLALMTFFALTRRLLFPLRRLAQLSVGLAGEDAAGLAPARALGNDEIASLARGVTSLADRLTQSREELVVLLERLREHDRARGQLIEKIITAQEDERRRLARELHDQTGQSLTSLLVGLKHVERAPTVEEMRARVDGLRQLTVQTLEEVHQLSLALRPAMLDDLGLVIALRALVAEFGKQHGIEAELVADALEQRLPPLYELTFYRIAQEALTNVAKYARAGRVVVELRLAAGRVELVIADDGAGFEPHAVPRDGREHLGIMGMQERVALIGGAFALDSTPGGGTRVTATAELPAAVEPASPPDRGVHA